jgi:enterochelin esterase-like enzyme
MLVLSVLIFILGASACEADDLPAATSAGFVNPEASLTPSEAPSDPIPINSLVLPETQSPMPIQTETPHPTVPSISQSPTSPPCTKTIGLLEDHQLDSHYLDEPLEYTVYLPPCYEEQLDRRYPVLYLFHGQTYSNYHWIDLGATQIADLLISSLEISPFIMVFPYDRDHYKPPTTNLFGKAVLLNLIPTIDRDYRTIPDRTNRAIGGISRGGNWAAHLSLQHPELFSAVGLHSTPIFSTDTNREILEWLESVPIDELPRFFLDIGQNDRWLKYTLVFEELLNDASVPHEWHLYPGFHEDDYWESHLEQYIRWYALAWNDE